MPFDTCGRVRLAMTACADAHGHGRSFALHSSLKPDQHVAIRQHSMDCISLVQGFAGFLQYKQANGEEHPAVLPDLLRDSDDFNVRSLVKSRACSAGTLWCCTCSVATYTDAKYDVCSIKTLCDMLAQLSARKL